MTNLCGDRRDKTMISMLRGWRIGRTLVKRKVGSKARFVTLFLMNLELLMPNIMLEFLNTFVIKGTYIYFGYHDKMYVINKHLIVDVVKGVG
jgi:hypothetical protein